MAMASFFRGHGLSGRRRRPGRQRGLLPPRGQAQGAKSSAQGAATRCGSKRRKTIGFWGMIHGDSFYGKTMGKPWENGGLMGFNGI